MLPTSFNSQKVKFLLAEFYAQNFEKAGIGADYGKMIVDFVSENKDKLSEESLRSKVNELFNNSKDLKTNPTNELDPINLFDFSNVERYLDFGANRLDALNKVSAKYKDIKELIACDVIPQSRPFLDIQRSKYYIIENFKQIPVEDNSLDIFNIQFVLHHVESEELINFIFSEARRTLKPEGKLILWEETFEEALDTQKLLEKNSRLNIQTDEILTKSFMELTSEEKWEFIIINDWIINVNNPHMQWSMQYKSWAEWVSLLESSGFKLDSYYNLGLRLNGRIKQGVHMIGIFNKL